MKLYIFILCPMPLLGQGQYHLYKTNNNNYE